MALIHLFHRHGHLTNIFLHAGNRYHHLVEHDAGTNLHGESVIRGVQQQTLDFVADKWHQQNDQPLRKVRFYLEQSFCVSATTGVGSLQNDYGP